MILILCEDSELGKAYTGIRNGLSGTIGKVQFTVKRTFKGRKETVRKQSVYWYV